MSAPVTRRSDKPCPAQEQCSRCMAKDAKIAEMAAEIHILRRRVHVLEAQPGLLCDAYTAAEGVEPQDRSCQHDVAVAVEVTSLHPTPLPCDEMMVVEEEHQAEVTRLQKEVRKGSACRCNSCCLCD